MSDTPQAPPAPLVIDAARAKSAIAQATFTAKETKLIDRLVRAVSAAAQNWCRREFALQQVDELYHGTDADHLSLRCCPVQEVTRVAFAPTAVLRVRNTDTTTNQRATIQVTTTGLKLLRVAAGAQVNDETITFASNVTLTACASAITALANGWYAEAVSPYGSWPSEDLRAIQGAYHCAGTDCWLKMHTQELSAWEIDAPAGLLYRTTSAGPVDWSADPRFRAETSGFGGARNWWRVIYTAGYNPIPEDVQEACAEWVADLFWSQQERPVMVGELLPTGHVLKLLQPYRRHCL